MSVQQRERKTGRIEKQIDKLHLIGPVVRVDGAGMDEEDIALRNGHLTGIEDMPGRTVKNDDQLRVVVIVKETAGIESPAPVHDPERQTFVGDEAGQTGSVITIHLIRTPEFWQYYTINCQKSQGLTDKNVYI